jgi:ATP-dependent DNA helicase RecG
VQKAVGAALDRLPELPEWIHPALRDRRGWPAWGDAVRRAHAPEAEADLLPTTSARERLAYDEIFASQLAVALVRARRHRQKGREIIGTAALTRRVEAALGFSLTGAQRLAIGEITARWRSRGAWCGSCKAMSAAARRSSR